MTWLKQQAAWLLFSGFAVFWMVGCSNKGTPCVLKRPIGQADPKRDEKSTSSWVPLFDLHANQFLGHVEKQGGLWVSAGSAGFAKYVQFDRPKAGWVLRTQVEGRWVALAKKQTRMQVPLTQKQASGTQVQVFLKSVPGASLQVRANGVVGSKATLAEGWQWVTLSFPSGVLKPGENTLLFSFSKAGAWSVGGASVQAAAAAAVVAVHVGGELLNGDVKMESVLDGTLRLEEKESRYYYIAIPKDSHLWAEGMGNGCTLKASVVSDGSTEKTQEVPLTGQPVLLQGVTMGQEAYRLGLHVQGACKEVQLRKIQLVHSGSPVVVNKSAKPRNVVVWMSDDTRADRFGLWNANSRVKTPVLDEFSKKATRFAVMYTQGNESRVSHASFFTGLYPAKHQFISDKAVLRSELNILPEVLSKAGLASIAHVSNGYVSPRWGFGDGWKVLHNHIHAGGGTKAEDLIRDAQDELSKLNTQPFFLYLGAVDAHVSWRPHEPWLSEYHPEPYLNPVLKKGLFDPTLDKILTGAIPINDQDKTWIKALYDSDLSYTDQQFGKLLDLLKKTGHDQDTMIVFTSDHGEEFWDHGRIGHGQSLHPELIHVPLWIYYPPLFPGGKVVQEGVELVDLLPTLAEAVGAAIPSEVQGESLVSLAQGVGAGYPRPAIASKYELAHTMRLGMYKLLVSGGGDVFLFDALADAGEKQDLKETRPIALRFIADPMGVWMAYQLQWKKSRWGVASNVSAAFLTDMSF